MAYLIYLELGFLSLVDCVYCVFVDFPALLFRSSLLIRPVAAQKKDHECPYLISAKIHATPSNYGWCFILSVLYLCFCPEQCNFGVFAYLCLFTFTLV